MDSFYSSLFSPSSSSSSSKSKSQYQYQSLLIRGGCLFILVVLFQYFIAQAPNVQKETKRRFQHALTGHSLVQISYVLPKSISLLLLSVGCILMYIMKTFFFEYFLKAFGPLLRPKELSGEVLPGAFYFLVGTAITICPGLITDNIMIVRYSVECLALADPMASWIGSMIPSPKFTINTSQQEGRTTTRTSSLSGCVACFVTAWIVGWWMLLLRNAADDNFIAPPGGDQFTVITLFLGAAACTIAEVFPYGNDNLNIPVMTAFVVEFFGRW